tara:strand:- start:7762 stop:8277 length:516 start_codon:yes stop_codon:yes gene_type:complete
MKYVDIDTGKVLTLDEVKQKSPGTSFTKSISLDTLKRLRCSTCEIGKEPSYGDYQFISLKDTATKTTDGKWLVEFEVHNMYQDIKDEDGKVIKTKAEQEKEHDESIAKSKAESLRAERNRRLEETDSYAVTDRTLSDEMKEYRKKLRDLPSDLSSKWPDLEESDWPEKPNK